MVLKISVSTVLINYTVSKKQRFNWHIELKKTTRFEPIQVVLYKVQATAVGVELLPPPTTYSVLP